MRKWFFGVVSSILIVLLVMSAVMYWVDPLFLYRYRDTGTYWIQPEWTSVGLIKNYDYDTVLIGSSVTQNFNAEEFGQSVGGSVLKVNSGGLSVTELEEYIRLIERTGRAKTCYVCIDIPQFAKSREEDINRIKKELTDDKFWNDYSYLLGYEAWTRFFPVNLGLSFLKTVGLEYPERIRMKTDVARSGEWKSDYSYGKDVVITNYQSGAYGVSWPASDGLSERMRERGKECLEAFTLDGDISYVFFFPPYSILYWREAQQQGILDAYLQFKYEFTKVILESNRAMVFDFQSEDYAAELEFYRDMTHYGPEINRIMEEQFSTMETRVTDLEGLEASIERMKLLIQALEEENQSWLK